MPVPPAPAATGGAAERLAATRKLVLSWWADYNHKRPCHATELGFDPAHYRGKGKPFFVFKLACLANILESRVPEQAQRDFFFELSGRRVLDRMFFEDLTLDQVFLELGYFSPAKYYGPLVERFPHFLRFRHALRRDERAIDRLEAAPDAREALRRLRYEMFGSSLEVGAFYVLREMGLMQLWRFPGIEEAAFVPERGTRETAYRLGFLDRHYAESFEELIRAAEAVGRHFRRKDGLDLPLRHFAEAHGCAFGCAHVATCPYDCREKSLVAR